MLGTSVGENKDAEILKEEVRRGAGRWETHAFLEEPSYAGNFTIVNRYRPELWEANGVVFMSWVRQPREAAYCSKSHSKTDLPEFRPSYSQEGGDAHACTPLAFTPLLSGFRREERGEWTRGETR